MVITLAQDEEGSASDQRRIARDLRELSAIGKNLETNGVTRLAYTDEEDAVLDYVASQARQIGLEISSDAFGNLFCLHSDSLRDCPIIIGSHLDTVQNGWAYDGTVGVVAALETMRVLAETDNPPPLVLAVSRAEESARFGRGDIGSRLAFGLLDVDACGCIYDWNGRSPLDAIHSHAANHSPKITPGWLRKARVFLEVHIEQSPILHQGGYSVGVVTGIAAYERYLLRIRGEAAHSGAIDYYSRRDAIYAACQIGVELGLLFKKAADEGSPTFVTIGRIDTPNGSINKVCDLAELLLDFRDVVFGRRSMFASSFRSCCEAICRERNTQYDIELLQRDDPVELSPHVTEWLAESCESLRVGYQRLPSGASHDALIAASVGIPTGMLFVPSVSGRSHCPDEESPLSSTSDAVNVLVRATSEQRSLCC